MTDRYDACIVGAGISGLNALFVASQYLSRDQRVILVDRRSRAGGMWMDTYDYVRLHQPHSLFTAGNIEWTLGKKPDYLATREEVLEHLHHCLEVIKRRIRVTELFGYEFENSEELAGKVRITCRSSEGRTMELEADRLIKAYGQGIETNPPLKLSSTRARSVSPDGFDVRGTEMRASDEPVWIVGAGKTGMDTAHALISDQPGREVNLIAGPGTLFASRDRFFPGGVRRWRQGKPISLLSMEMARRFDGTNEADVMSWFGDNYGVRLTPQTGNFLFAFLSEAENDTIAKGLNEVVMDYFDDVVDRDGGAELVLRSGATMPVEPGSWVVNCTGSLMRGEHSYEPYASASGRVLSIQNRSATIPFPAGGAAAYFLTHLMFLDKLTQVPLYAMDVEELRRKAPQYVMAVGLTPLQLYNLSLMAEAIPAGQFRKIVSRNGLDFNRWYPLPRRLRASIGFMLTHKREREHYRRTLDKVAERFGVRCGPVVGAGQA
ncbi:NAD(P)-binding protein [Wenzhouxiangella sp. AB-CW3]|uniref:NAD(P)-binding protein n=1 Tax=Wenzhouxiangella sp. AB-CW3 TaxID=2771012 RepID=UPI00168A7AA1|nr:NAD(P)-binding protein [Wenzhouxiangella sp. AB-CW3]QOC23246.1 NAD(P)-binding protein [Wenzhouxiangella sp. AB-CW3]